LSAKRLRSTPRRIGLERAISLVVPLLLVMLLLDARAQPAAAVILPAVTIAGPSPEIVGFGGVAMAEDGSGGIVYLQRVGGVDHVFVARYVEGHWLAPIQVDRGEPYAASWPRIGASDDGQLVVVWATPFATEKEEGKERPVDELLGATLDPGSSEFGEPVIVDPDIGDATGTSPEIAMSSTDQADVVYRVIDGAGKIPLLHPGDVDEEVRVAHYEGERWLALGAVNRSLGISMRPPTPANAPQIAIAPTGAAVVVWQEPEINGVARIWARRLFAANLDYVLPVSATSFNGASINTEADAPSVAMSLLGQAVVAYRQAGGPGSPLPGARIFLNTLPDGESENGSVFTGAELADAGVPGGAGAKIGPPSIDLDEHREVRLIYDADGVPRVVTGTDKGLLSTVSLGPQFGGAEAPATSVMNPAGGGVSAWVSAEPNGTPAVAVREDFPSGAVQTALVGGGAGGPVGELAVGRSSLGDGLVAFQQGAVGGAAIVAAVASAPPAEVILSAPKGWIKPSQAVVSWAPPLSADGPLTYHVVLDGRQLAVPTGASELRLDARRLGSGSHTVALLATDIDGQATLSPPSTLRIDGSLPIVAFRRAGPGHAIVVRVSDAFSGVDAKAVTVSFGDGHSAGGRKLFRHTYARAGVYTVTVHVRDNIGNAGVVTGLASVR
jgi:PKD domain-containing protein